MKNRRPCHFLQSASPLCISVINETKNCEKSQVNAQNHFRKIRNSLWTYIIKKQDQELRKIAGEREKSSTLLFLRFFLQAHEKLQSSQLRANVDISEKWDTLPEDRSEVHRYTN